MGHSSSLKAGFIAIMGRPNVGKSTLLNKILGYKLSSTSRRPQTTRHKVLAVHTTEQYQCVFVDTPGVHRRANASKMFKQLNRTATTALHEVDFVIFVVEALKWTDEDEVVFQAIKNSGLPTILVVNKVDRIGDKEKLLPFLEEQTGKYNYTAVVPISASKGKNLENLMHCVEQQLDEVDEFFYPEEEQSLQSPEFYASEMIREKLMRHLGDELPYSTAVEIEKYEYTEKLIKIAAVIWVERPGQKGIVIGAGGKKLKLIGQQARLDIEGRFNQKVFLQLWVKVRENWSDDEKALRSFGYFD